MRLHISSFKAYISDFYQNFVATPLVFGQNKNMLAKQQFESLSLLPLPYNSF